MNTTATGMHHMTDTSAWGASPHCHTTVDVSVVVIGKNEGLRLQQCLRSVAAAHWHKLRHELIYVDSGSSDGSPAVAEGLGASVLVLDDPRPNAAKARNLGWQQAQGRFVLFLDGDTELHPDFVVTALDALREPSLCAAWGHRRESRPQDSVYNRVLDLDWIYPVGETLYFGGDVLVRREALVQAGGYDNSLNAGEEPELCARLRALGWRIEHIDAPMTRHDLAITSARAWARRCYRSGIAYAEVAHRMQQRDDPLWQEECRRDRLHGFAYALSPVLLLVTALTAPQLALVLLLVFVLAGLALLLRSAWRCRWKTTHPVLALQYALHSHLQKLPALVGQLAWRRAHARRQSLALVDYKATPARHAFSVKSFAAGVLAPLARLQRTALASATRLWAFARLREALGGKLHSSNVVLGAVELHGTRRVRFGQGALIYPGVYLETQGEGSIEIGDRVVLSRGVHIVAFDKVLISDDCLIGEYTSIRDANHRLGTASTRHSGHDSAPVTIGRNVWLGRGVSVLKGCTIGEHTAVGANAVVTHSLAASQRAVGIPARAL